MGEALERRIVAVDEVGELLSGVVLAPALFFFLGRLRATLVKPRLCPLVFDLQSER
jgi:hypothetical protein